MTERLTDGQSGTDEQLFVYRERLPQRSDSRTRLSVAPDQAEQQHAVGKYISILLRRRWTILATMVIITTLVAIATFKMTPIYEATASVEVDSETPQIRSLNEMYKQAPLDESFLPTQARVLETDNLPGTT